MTWISSIVDVSHHGRALTPQTEENTGTWAGARKCRRMCTSAVDSKRLRLTYGLSLTEDIFFGGEGECGAIRGEGVYPRSDQPRSDQPRSDQPRGDPRGTDPRNPRWTNVPYDCQGAFRGSDRTSTYRRGPCIFDPERPVPGSAHRGVREPPARAVSAAERNSS